MVKCGGTELLCITADFVGDALHRMGKGVSSQLLNDDGNNSIFCCLDSFGVLRFAVGSKQSHHRRHLNQRQRRHAGLIRFIFQRHFPHRLLCAMSGASPISFVFDG